MRAGICIWLMAVIIGAPQVLAEPPEAIRSKGIAKSPRFISARPLYGVLAFGKDGAHPVWMVLDQSTPESISYDVLYLDLAGDGDLTRPTARYVAPRVKVPDKTAPSSVFKIGKFKEPGSERVHTDLVITWGPERMSYRFNWLGQHSVGGGYGTSPQTYSQFSTTAATAPIFSPNFEGPFRFQHWMSGKLVRGADNDFKLFLGTLGNGPGTFSGVDDHFLPPTDHVVATLIYTDKSGQERKTTFNLRDRC